MEKNTTGNSTHHLHPNYQQYSKSVDHNKFTKPIIEQHIHHITNDSIETRQSNIHHIRQNNYSHNNLTASNYPTSSSSSTASNIDRKPIQYERISLMDQSNQIMSNNAAGKQIIMENQFTTNSLSSVRGDDGGRVNGGGVDVKINKNQHEKIITSSMRKRDDTIGDGFGKKSPLVNAENHYGRIQSRTFSASVNGGSCGVETSSKICGGNYDRCNANNIQVKNDTKRCDNSNGVMMNCVNNNHYDIAVSGHQFNHHNGNNNMSENLMSDVGKSKFNSGQSVNSSTVQTTNIRNMLRTNRYSNGNHLTAPGTHQLAHMMNTLSSPESAYSTGYSTDGTSPGKSLLYFFLDDFLLKATICS